MNYECGYSKETNSLKAKGKSSQLVISILKETSPHVGSKYGEEIFKEEAK